MGHTLPKNACWWGRCYSLAACNQEIVCNYFLPDAFIDVFPSQTLKQTCTMRYKHRYSSKKLFNRTPIHLFTLDSIVWRKLIKFSITGRKYRWINSLVIIIKWWTLIAPLADERRMWVYSKEKKDWEENRRVKIVVLFYFFPWKFEEVYSVTSWITGHTYL